MVCNDQEFAGQKRTGKLGIGEWGPAIPVSYSCHQNSYLLCFPSHGHVILDGALGKPNIVLNNKVTCHTDRATGGG